MLVRSCLVLLLRGIFGRFDYIPLLFGCVLDLIVGGFELVVAVRHVAVFLLHTLENVGVRSSDPMCYSVYLLY
jgi:hypothetical protein